MRGRRTTTTLIAIAAAAALLAGCGTDDGGDDATEPSTTQSTTSEAPTSEEPTSDEPTSEEPTSEEPTAELEPFPDTTDDQSSEPTDAALLLVDVRVAAHDGYDRVVLEFEGDEAPGWQVGYVDAASTDGAGEPIELEGDAILQVAATHTMPDDMSGYYDGPREIDADLSSIEEVFVDGSFEGYTTVYLGLDEQVPFRVLTLTEPSRLVVDVPNADG